MLWDVSLSLSFRCDDSYKHSNAELAGLYAGNPKPKTERPRLSQLLAAFGGITLYHHRDRTCEITPLNDLQRRILALMKLPETIYALPVQT